MRVLSVALFGFLLSTPLSTQSPTTVSQAVVTETGIASRNQQANGAIPIIKIDEPVHGPLNATAWALIYVYPLYIFANWAGGVLRNVSVNEILHSRSLAAIGSAAVVKPNIDTTYSKVVLDLSKNDVILTIPNITDRYYVYPVYDSFGNAIAEIGSVNRNKPGKYLIRRADDVPGPSSLQNVSDLAVQTNYAGSKNYTQYAGIVNLPTTHGTMLIRFLVRENTTEDLDIVHRYQDASKLTTIPRNISQAASPCGNLSSLAPNGSLAGISSPKALLSFASQFTLFNQPELFSERQRVAAILGQAGIYDGTYTPQHGVNLTRAAQIANASITADISDPKNVRQQGNEWQLSTVENQGNYGRNYASRAYVTINGYQEQTVSQVLYPGYQSLGFSSVTKLEPNTSLLFEFSGKPQLFNQGFWSLAVYGNDQYLIPNDLRAEVGDRTHSIIYRDGGKVYGPEADTQKDGAFEVLLQPVDQPPPSNWTGNWLPVEQEFSFVVRWYTPKPAMTNGSYVYPKVQTIEAIV